MFDIRPHFGNPTLDLNDVLHGGGVFQQVNQTLFLDVPGLEPGLVVNQSFRNVGGRYSFVDNSSQATQSVHRVVQVISRHPNSERSGTVTAFAEYLGRFHPTATLGGQRFHQPHRGVDLVDFQADPRLHDELPARLGLLRLSLLIRRRFHCRGCGLRRFGGRPRRRCSRRRGVRPQAHLLGGSETFAVCASWPRCPRRTRRTLCPHCTCRTLCPHRTCRTPVLLHLRPHLRCC